MIRNTMTAVLSAALLMAIPDTTPDQPEVEQASVQTQKVISGAYTWDDVQRDARNIVVNTQLEPEVIPTPVPDPDVHDDTSDSAPKSYTQPDVKSSSGCTCEVRTESDVRRIVQQELENLNFSSTPSGGSSGAVVRRTYQTRTTRAGGGSTGGSVSMARTYSVVQPTYSTMSVSSVGSIPLNPGETLVPGSVQVAESVTTSGPVQTQAASTPSPVLRGPLQRVLRGRYYVGSDGCTYDSRTGRRVSCPIR